VERVDPSFHAGCECGEICDSTKCSCLSQEESSDDRIVAYKKGRNNTTVLRSDFMKRRAMIYECSSLCSCELDCWNRVVQHGRTVRLEIFDTGDRGFGEYTIISDPSTDGTSH
jgi:histone-lysine N-methyltransferase SUV39H